MSMLCADAERVTSVRDNGRSSEVLASHFILPPESRLTDGLDAAKTSSPAKHGVKLILLIKLVGTCGNWLTSDRRAAAVAGGCGGKNSDADGTIVLRWFVFAVEANAGSVDCVCDVSESEINGAAVPNTDAT